MGKYSDADIERGLQALAEYGGSVTRAATETGIPATTLYYWKTKNFAGEFENLRIEKRKGLIEELQHTLIEALKALVLKFPEMVGKDVAIAFGIMADKYLNLQGEASERIDLTSGGKPLEKMNDDERIERLFAIVDKARARGNSEPGQ